MAWIHESCRSSHTMGCLGNKMWQSQGGYLQVVSLYKVCMTDSSPLLPQIQENYMQILANGHSKLSEDIASFIFCSFLPQSYQDLVSQYLISIEDITKYKLQKIIARVIKEESWCKVWTNAVASGLRIHKFTQINKYNKHCDKCGINNHNTVDHWDTPPNHTNKGEVSKPIVCSVVWEVPRLSKGT